LVLGNQPPQCFQLPAPEGERARLPAREEGLL
jgi:hypothetical protein